MNKGKDNQVFIPSIVMELNNVQLEISINNLFSYKLKIEREAEIIFKTEDIITGSFSLCKCWQ